VNDFICPTTDDQINAASSAFCHVTLTIKGKASK